MSTLLPGTPPADEIVRAYLLEVASRYYGRPATPAEVEQVLRDEPYADLTGTTGIFLAAMHGDRAVACAGARFLGEVAELTKVFTLPDHRGAGLGRQLVGRIEQECSTRGITSLRLDTRSDLTEACALYEGLGFERVPAFNDEPYSDRWYAKSVQVREAP